MSVPGQVQVLLGEEDVATRLRIDSDETLYVTATRVIVHRDSSLLSDEEVEEFPIAVDRLAVEEGRRSSQVTFTYRVDEDRTLTISNDVLEELMPVLFKAVLWGNDVIEPGEDVLETFFFKELTLAVTDRRLLKHLGYAIWDGDFEQYPYGDVDGVATEEGTVANQLVLELDGHVERLKVPQEESYRFLHTFERALCAFHDVDALADIGTPGADRDDGGDDLPFMEDIDPLVTGGTDDDAEAESDPDEGFEPRFESTAFEAPDHLEPDAEAKLDELIGTVADLEARLDAVEGRLDDLDA